MRVRELVVTNWATSVSNAFSGERRSRPLMRWWPASGSDTQACTSRMDRPPSAAACSSAARTRRPWASQNSRSPDPPRPVPVVTAPSMSAARSAAVTGSAQPVSGSNVIVDGSPARPTALNTYTGPRRGAQAAVVS